MSAPVMAGGSGQPADGLTHPAPDKRWFGHRIGDHFFRLVDGDRYLAVLKGAKSEFLVDAILFEASGSDPRPVMKRLATDWATKRGLVRP